MYIIGAGLSGLIAANVLRAHKPIILEAQKELPNNHEALLRFKTDAVAKATGIPFKKVWVRKALVDNNMFLDRPNPYACNRYSYKVTGEVLDRSIWNFEAGERWIAPMTLVGMLAGSAQIVFGKAANLSTMPSDAPVISTVPMPIMMDAFNWKLKPTFKWRPIWVLAGELISPRTDVCQTIHFSCLGLPYYRASLIGRRFILEYIEEPSDPDKDASDVLAFFGLDSLTGTKLLTNEIKRQEYGKIIPIDEEIRQEFIYFLTREHGVYSLGRFATWRQILLDDIVHDIEIIQRLIIAEGRRRNYATLLEIARPT